VEQYSNIDLFYQDNRELLLESNVLRPCKSVPRNIFNYVEKFSAYRRIQGERSNIVNVDAITYDVLRLDDWNDVVTTAIRVMRELDFIEDLGNGDYRFSNSFDVFLHSNKSSEYLLIERMKKIFSISDMTMLYNSIICTLREGYLNGKIVLYPDSCKKFHQAFKDIEDRKRIRKEVYEIYGFAGRAREWQMDNYTPNANYRTITILTEIGYIDPIDSPYYGIRMYRLTTRAHEYLRILNQNLDRS